MKTLTFILVISAACLTQPPPGPAPGIPHCKTEYPADDPKFSGCKICKTGYFKKRASSTSLQQAPVPKNKYDCGDCLRHCKRCVNYDTCDACEKGYRLVKTHQSMLSQMITKDKCVPCSKECETCNAEGQCTSCKNNYYPVSEVGDTKTCKPCVEGCSQCTSKSTCISCKDGYYNEDGKCLKCGSGCETCVISRDKCTKCKKGFAEKAKKPQVVYQPSTRTFECIRCISVGCEECDVPGTCLKCKESTTLTDGKCVFLIKKKSYLWMIIGILFLAVVLLTVGLIVVCVCCLKTGGNKSHQPGVASGEYQSFAKIN